MSTDYSELRRLLTERYPVKRDDLERALPELLDEIERLREELRRGCAYANNSERAREEFIATIDRDRDRIAQLEAALDEANQSITELEAKILRWLASSSKLEAEILRQRDWADEYEERIAQLETALREIKDSACHYANETVESLKSRIDGIYDDARAALAEGKEST